jgi:hypothetical protein
MADNNGGVWTDAGDGPISSPEESTEPEPGSSTEWPR